MAVSTITVLVIDNTRARVSTLRLLSAAGYSTVEAQRGSEALKLLEDRVAATGSSGVDAILKNHDPPESNAVRFLHRLREHPALRAIPTIIVSNLDSREVVLKCLSSGAADYWVRPLRPNEVRVLWTRVWRPQAPVQVLGGDDSGSGNSSDAAANLAEETEPTSKEGSAPDHGSSGDRGKQDTNAAAGSGSGVDDQEAGLTNGIGNGSSRNMGKMDSNTGGAGGSGGDNRNGSGDNGGNGTSAIGQFVPGHSNHVQCDASTAAQAALGMPALPPSQQLSHHHHHRSHSHHRSHHHHPPAVPSAAATEAGSEAPAAWQRLLAAQDAVAAATATVAAAPPLATRPAQAHAPRAQRAALDVFPSPAARPRLLPEQQAAAAGAAAAGMPCTASQVSGDGQYNGGNTGNGSNGATTNGNGGNGNGHGGVTSKQHTAASPLPLQLQIQQALRCSMPASPGSVLPLLPVAAAAGPHPKPWPSPSLAAACWPSSRQQRRQRQLLLQQIKEEEQEEERQRGAAEVADVCEALASLRDSGSPLNSCGMPGGAATGSVPAPAGPGGSTASGKAGRLTRATVAAAAALARAHAAQSVPDSMTAASTDTRHFQQQQQQAVPASTPSQPLSLAAPPALFPPPLPQLFMQQQQAAAVVSRQSPAQSPRHPAAVFAPQQQQQQQQMLPPPFPAGLMPAFGGMPPFLGPHVGFAWGGMPALPSPQQQQYMQQPAQMQAKASAGATSPTASQQGAGAAAGQQAGSQAAVDGTVDAAGQQMHSLLEQQQRAMLAQQHGQQQAQYAWMLQQYSMAAVAAAATGQLPPPPPPPPPLAGAFGNLMGWARPPLPWQQQLPPGLSFPTPSFMAPPTLQPPGPATSSLLPPPSTAGSAHPPATLPPLPLPAPLEMLSEEQLTKKETRLLAYARYMEKRKRLHFGKKIRYQTRKALADQRPRVRGQFVRMAKEEAASTGDNKVSASDGGASTMSGSPSPDSQLPAAQEDTATGGPVVAAVALAAVTAGGDGCSPAIVTPACPSPISTAGQQRDEAMEGQEEDQEYDHQEEDLGADEEDLPQPMALAIQPRPRRQHAILRQDESESATMSFGSTAAHHRQGFVSLHPHQQQQGTKLAVAMTAAAASAMALCAGSQPAGTSTTGSPGAEHKGADTVGWQQQLHHHLTGHKHRREPLATAADTSAGGGRNGSDSGSNTPGDHTPMPDSPHGARGHLDAAQLAPPSKQPRMRK